MRQGILFLGVAALGSVTYHLGQRTISTRANPMVLLMAVYAVAFVLSALAVPLFRAGTRPVQAAELLAWPVLVLAAGVVLIEIGFLLAYRAGDMLSWSGVAVNGAAALVLVPISLAFFNGVFTLSRALGILLTLGGLAMLTR